uniref:Putative tetraspanin n=1 Tax=Corethrella appendiculata TaxID=1370023 RepID=U5EPZ8_9DIPT
MRLSSRIKCFKYLVYTYIVLISICAGVQIVIGSFLLWSHQQYSKIVDNQFWEPFVTIICLGLVSILICYVGWTSTSKKNRCYLGLFAGGLVVLIIVQFLTSGWIFAMRYQMLTPAEIAIENSHSEYLVKTSQDPTHLWNRLQRDLQCCGKGGAGDYHNSKQKALPWSCCAKPINPNDPPCSFVYQRGCLHVLVDSIQYHLLICALTSVSAALVQSLGIFCVIQLTVLLKRPTLNISSPDSENQIRPKKHTREMIPLAQQQQHMPTPHHIKPKPVAPPKVEEIMKSSLG